MGFEYCPEGRCKRAVVEDKPLYLADKVYMGLAGNGGDPMVDYITQTLLVAQVAQKGHIGSKWFNKHPEGNRLPFLTTVAADGNAVELEIDGINDTSIAQQMGMRIVVIRPDGTKKDSGLVWELWPYTGGYGTHHFVFDNFITITQEGAYNIEIELWMK